LFSIAKRFFPSKKRASKGCGVALPYSTLVRPENASKTASKELLAVGCGVSREKQPISDDCYYILENKRPVECHDRTTWARWSMDAKNMTVAKTRLHSFVISTIFLGRDHSFGCGDLILFETVVFGEGGEEVKMERYGIWEEAEMGHYRVVDEVSRLMQMRTAGVECFI
jgi:hypothetical protein